MKIIKVGHSEINPRQYFLTQELQKYTDIISMYPSKWGTEVGLPTNYNEGRIGLNPTIENFYTFYLDDFEQLYPKINPDILYCMEEPYTFFARVCKEFAQLHKTKLIYFTWENKIDFNNPRPQVEIENIEAADMIICGNDEAQQRILSLCPEAKTTIIPQTGINTNLFCPMNTEKSYDVGYIGRFSPEKLMRFNEFTNRNPNLRSIAIGGRGEYMPVARKTITWLDYQKLPEYYNQIKTFLHLVHSYKGYQEQFCYGIAEALSCGTSVITTNNGSISSVYASAPNLHIVEEKCKTNEIELLLKDMIRESDKGRKWIINNLSLEIIAKSYLKVFREVLK